MAEQTDFAAIGFEHLKKACAADAKDEYAEALHSYTIGGEYLLRAVKYAKTPVLKKFYEDKLTLYLARAEKLKAYIKSKSGDGASPSSKNANADQITRPASGGGSGGGDENAMQELLMFERPNVSWEDVAGLETAKRFLHEAVILPLELPHLYGPGKPLTGTKGVLLYGPPGTGKTYLVKALATEARAAFLLVKCKDVFGKYVGDSEKAIDKIFRMARAQKGVAIIFFDEIDAIAKRRGDDTHDVSLRVMSELLQQVDGAQVGQKPDDARVVLLAATNLPWLIDDGMMRRFEKRIYIPLPDDAARGRMLHRLGQKLSPANQLSPEHLEQLVLLTRGYSADDVGNCIRSAGNLLLQKAITATHFLDRTGTLEPCSPGAPGAQELSYKCLTPVQKARIVLPPLRFSDILQAVQETRPSVHPDSITRYEDFTDSLGTRG